MLSPTTLFAQHATLFKASLFLLAGLLAGCSSPPPTEQKQRALLERWYIDGNPESLDTLLRSVADCKTVSGLLRARPSQQKQHRGAGLLSASDRSGQQFTIGTYNPHSAANPAPLLIYLHGGIARSNNDKGRLAWDMFRPLADSIGIVLASPSATAATPWWSAQGIERVLQTARLMSQHFPIDPRRIYCAGVSDGALGCFAVASSAPAPFAGFFPISGFGGLLEQTPIGVLPSNLIHRPFYCINGSNDQLYAISQVRAFAESLTLRGVPIEQSVFENMPHGFDYRALAFASIASRIALWRRPQKVITSWQTTPGYPSTPDNVAAIVPIQEQLRSSFSLFWQHDTLIAAGVNIRTLSLSGLSTQSLPIKAAINAGPVRRISPGKRDLALQLTIARNRATIFPDCQGVYTLDFAGNAASLP